jgi:hypothetical protein
MFGLAAIAVPIVLHLIARREPRRVVFPSIVFLTKRLETNRSKLRVRRWWLLALRIAALAALALALAHPAIHQSLSLTWLTIGLIVAFSIGLLAMATTALSRGMSRTLIYSLTAAGVATLAAAVLWGGYTYASGKAPAIDDAAPVAIALVLDNSPTSAWKTAGDDRLARIKEVATWMATRLPPTSRIAIVDRSATPVAFSLDLASAVSKIDGLPVAEATMPMAGKIEAAIRLVRTSELEGRQVLVITDLAESTWQTSSAESLLAAALADEPAVQMSVFDLGPFAGSNRTLSIPQFADTTPPRGNPVTLTSLLSLATDQEAPASVTAELKMYDADPTLPVIRNGVVQRPRSRIVDRSSVQISAGGSSELRLTIPPLDVGQHHGVLQLVGDDALPLDDVRYFTVGVLTPSRVLLVADNEDEARSIDLTINAAPFEVDESNAEYLVERIGYADLPVVRLEDFDAILLLDPPADVITGDAVGEYVAQGGGALVCLGPAAGNEALTSSWLPPLVRRWRSPAPHTFLEPLRPSHPVLSPLSEIPGGVPWSAYRVGQYWQITPAETDKVLVRFAGAGHPAVLERSVPVADGLPGITIITTTPLPDLADPNNDWNDLFGSDAWPAFFLVRNMVQRLTRRGAEDWMTVVGQPKVIGLPAIADDAEAAETIRLQLFPPGQTAPVPINVPRGATQVVAGDVTRSGTYWLRGLGENIGFSVNLTSQATMTERVDRPVLDQWFGAENYDLVTNQDEIELAEIRSAQRVSLRSPLMLLALAVFLLEQILGNRFYRSRSAAGGPLVGGAAA